MIFSICTNLFFLDKKNFWVDNRLCTLHIIDTGGSVYDDMHESVRIFKVNSKIITLFHFKNHQVDHKSRWNHYCL